MAFSDSNSRVLTAACLLVLGICTAKAKTCHFPYNNLTNTLASVCFEELGNENGYAVRQYSNRSDEGALVVRYNVSATVQTYQEALELGTFTVLDYFEGGNAKNLSLADARTTPLLLRPRHPAAGIPWFVEMAIAPGLVPHPPAPLYGVEITPLCPQDAAQFQVAARHERLNSSPQPSDFEACAAKLIESLKLSSLWRYNASSPASPSFAYFTGQFDISGPYDIECWVGVDSV